MGWTSIRAAVKTKLESISEIAFVADTFTQELTSFPAAIFEPSQDPSKFATNKDNEHVYTFDIFVIQEIENKGRAEAVRILSAAVDAVVSAFDADLDIGGSCHYAEAMAGEWGTDSMGQGMVKWARLTVKAHVLAAT